jgi:hypothetical protein
VYVPASSKEVALLRDSNKGQIMMFNIGDNKIEYETSEIPLQLAEQIFNKIGEYLVEKTVIDVDMIIEKMTQQYEYDQKTNGEVKE